MSKKMSKWHFSHLNNVTVFLKMKEKMKKWGKWGNEELDKYEEPVVVLSIYSFILFAKSYHCIKIKVRFLHILTIFCTQMWKNAPKCGKMHPNVEKWGKMWKKVFFALKFPIY